MYFKKNLEAWRMFVSFLRAEIYKWIINCNDIQWEGRGKKIHWPNRWL